jgi:hypothetical protein
VLTFFVSADRTRTPKNPIFPGLRTGRVLVSLCPHAKQRRNPHKCCVRRPETAYHFVSAHFLLSEWTRNAAAEAVSLPMLR